MAVAETPPSTPNSLASEAEKHAPGDKEMTLIEHLEELRSRLVKSAVAVLVGVLAAIVPVPGLGSVTDLFIGTLAARAPAGKLVAIGPGEALFTYLQVAMLIGIALSMPVIVYQVLSFVSPALYEHEKRYLYIAVPGVTGSFAAGAAFCYFFMLPFAIAFLGGFKTDIFEPLWSSERYLDFVTTFMFWVGLTFELPIVMYFLTKLGVVSAKRLASFRKYAFVLAFVIGAIITPTPDPINQTIVSLPIYLLFEVGVLLARFA
jgi:sec-independent protein translocase protein TatC